VSEKVEEKEIEEEVVIGEKLSTEYRTKVSFKESAEFRMILYVVPVGTVLALITYFLSRR
jgi:hypothetical protein